MCVTRDMTDCFSHVSCSAMLVSRGDETSQNLSVRLEVGVFELNVWWWSSCSVGRSWVLTGRTAGSPMLRPFWRTWPCLQTRSPSQENWQLLPLDPRLWSWALLSLWAHWQHTISHHTVSNQADVVLSLFSWTWPWRRRWLVSGWRSPAWRNWAAVTTQTPVTFWTSCCHRVRTVQNPCTATGCPATAPSKLWVRSLFYFTAAKQNQRNQGECDPVKGEQDTANTWAALLVLVWFISTTINLF